MAPRSIEQNTDRRERVAGFFADANIEIRSAPNWRRPFAALADLKTGGGTAT